MVSTCASRTGAERTRTSPLGYGEPGFRCGWPGPRATMLHLWHEPKPGTMPSNKELVKESLASEHIEAVRGLRELAAQLRAEDIACRERYTEASALARRT